MSIFPDTDRMRLRPFTEDDVDNLVALDADPEVMRFLDGGKPTPRERVVSEVMPRVLRGFPVLGGAPGMWAAEERATGAFLGWFEMRPVDAESAEILELGYRLRREAWGRGLATEGSLTLVDKAFTEYVGVERIVADTMTVNSRSRRVMEKCGLTFQRTFFQDWPELIDGSEHGEVEYALTRDRWAARRADPEAAPERPSGA
ncbi:GNAT family N-acetyltransferase [Yinghuangia seranimata]|uniref:GNAT family N-acetyltransferase n=1 Tax=Yinghuangia seranimata TaxID=408067 RepID=UPI00248D2B8E|nr:GNAT family N-acetyltransferase [Yinghuangia seranimata]MDI2130195.1 GNAT family N-acetyltransferase [Yinghuangia seranimata]